MNGLCTLRTTQIHVFSLIFMYSWKCRNMIQKSEILVRLSHSLLKKKIMSLGTQQYILRKTNMGKA